MIGHARRYFLFGLLTLLCGYSISQEQSGYLVRVYDSKEPDFKTFTGSLRFSGFLEKASLESFTSDSVSYDVKADWTGLGMLISKVFGNELQLIDPIPRKKEFADTSCYSKNGISLEDIFFYDFVYVYKSPDEKFYHAVFVNKVNIESCLLKQYSEYELSFKERLVLRSVPCFGLLTENEKDLFADALGMITNLKGKTFYRR